MPSEQAVCVLEQGHCRRLQGTAHARTDTAAIATLGACCRTADVALIGCRRGPTNHRHEPTEW